MKHLYALLFVFLVGDCVQLVRGVFKGETWTVFAVHDNGTFDLVQNHYILRDVKGSYLSEC
jgi:hypothetical protein